MINQFKNVELSNDPTTANFATVRTEKLSKQGSIVAKSATVQIEAVFGKDDSTRITLVRQDALPHQSSSRMWGSRDTDSSQRSITLVEPERFNKPLTPSGNRHAWIPAFARKTYEEYVFHYELDTSGLGEMDCRATLAMTEGKKTRHCEEPLGDAAIRRKPSSGLTRGSSLVYEDGSPPSRGRLRRIAALRSQ